ncbi:hypothetical protein JTE90_025369 [Oedothorax gibbosus]|uniref:Uncharacterized protein n=1 Tax=Oedothorax gibbosus TaxID=931172 RepID=A0AAV6TS20_9ARAC|nr:hypothetical protein JTE90_025369 [Oedothorax gibbosus]
MDFNRIIVRIAEEHSNYPLHMNFTTYPRTEDLELPPFRQWVNLDRLPTFDIPDGENDEWNDMLIGYESHFISVNNGTDQEVLMSAFGDYLTHRVLRSNGSFGSDEIRSLVASLQSFREGEYSRKPSEIDQRGYGIKRKLKVSKMVKVGEWERLDFDIPKGYPDWVEDEVEGLLVTSDVEWLELPDLPEYTEIDNHV